MPIFSTRGHGGRATTSLGSKALALLVTLIFWQPDLQAETATFTMPTTGCPMAHCDGRMSDAVNVVGPAIGVAVRIDKASSGAVRGLGCVYNSRLVACTGGGDPATLSNLVVYDAEGNRVWEDHGILGANAWTSAAMISADGNVIAADSRWILRADPLTNTVIWKSAKPDTGKPISPVPVGSSARMVLLATVGADDGTRPEMSVWDVGNGALLAHQAIVDPVTAKTYITINTPAVRGNRVYVLTSAEGDPADGRLYAFDICESASCGTRGGIKVAWYYAFTGPSAASPLVIGSRIFFDGVRGKTGGNFHAVDDRGSAARRVWRVPFAARFAASAAQDSRGGLWVYPWGAGTLLRLSESTGATLQTVNLGTVLGAGYSPVTATSVSRTATGAVVLTFGAQAANASEDSGPQVAAVDVSSTAAGTLLWKYKVSSSALRNASTGQFPVVTGLSGGRRVVFRGTDSATFFIGEP